MTRTLKFLLTLLAGLLPTFLTACVTSGPEEMAKTISGGWIYRDGKPVYTLDEIRKDKPVALFLHGCLGFTGRQFSVMDMIDQKMFEVVAPDSFVRAKSRVTCKGQTMHLRKEEIDYALQQLRTITQQPIVLVGFSEGARAVALWSGEVKIAGKAVLAYDCFHGLRENVPVLNLQGRHDTEIARGNALCDTKNAHYVDAGHDVSDDPQAKVLLQAFMKGVLGG